MKNHTWELKKKRFEKKVKKILFFYVFPILFLFAFFVLLFNSSFLEIKSIQLNLKDKQNNLLNKEKIQNEVNLILSGKYYGIFSKKNFIFYPKKEIETKLLNNFLSIKKINIQYKDSYKNLILNIESEKEKYIACKTENKRDCYFINNDGRIFKKTKFQKNSLLILNKNLKLNHNIFDNKENTKKILNFTKKIETKFKLKVKKIKIKNNFTYIFILKNDEKLILSLDFDFKKIISILDKIFKHKDLKIINGKFQNPIAYIDLTLENRIPYCLKGDICENNF